VSQRWLTTREAAEFLGVHPNTIRNWADGGKLHARRTTGNQRRFDPDELAKHVLAEGGRRGQAPPPPPAPSSTASTT
jgi:excisionase family DNA binding protein